MGVGDGMQATGKALGRRAVLAAPLSAVIAGPAAAQVAGDNWAAAWPKTDFRRSSVEISDIISGGPPRDGIPPIDRPVFAAPGDDVGLAGREPVIGLILNGEARAYPLQVLTWHEIVNDVVGGIPVCVTYCPLCNTAIVFDRRLDGQALDFGTTGKLRHSDLIMYDRQTESWWQQYGGDAIIGTLMGKRLAVIPARLESLAVFRARSPKGVVLVPGNPGMRRYGANPYVGYDSAPAPFLFGGEMPPGGVAPMMRVVAVGDVAWTLPLLRARGSIAAGDLLLGWREGQASALDTSAIAEGAEVGNVVVQRAGGDAAYVVTFAFAFFAFNPAGVLHTEAGLVRR